ncbi:hypothetical protein AMK59_2678, partial [Oryctes borbonicus]
GDKMQSKALLLFSFLTLIYYSENSIWLREAKTTVPFSAVVQRENLDGFDTMLINGSVNGKNIATIRAVTTHRVLKKDTFVSLPVLVQLYLTNIGVYELASGFIKDVPSLLMLDLGFNQIRRIRNGVFSGRFAALYRLALHNNEIEEIERRAFSNFSATYLSLSNNRLTLVGDWFKNTSLYSLDLTNNHIAFLVEDTFKKIENLQVIELAMNRIQFIEPKTFTLTKYTFINLSHNFLYDINFLDRVASRSLDISYNQVSRISLPHDVRIGTLTIYPNPWNCHCLHEFWRLAWKLRISYGFRFSEPKKSIPICIYRNECHEDDTQLQREYLKNLTMLNQMSYS